MNMAARRTCLEARAEPTVELPERSDKAASADRPEGRLSPWKGVQGVRKVGESDAVHQNFRSEATRRLLPTGRKAVRPPGRGCRGLGRSENPTLFIRTKVGESDAVHQNSVGWLSSS